MAATIGESLETSSGRMFSLIALLYAWTHFWPSFLLIAPTALDCAGSETKRNSDRMRNRMALVLVILKERNQTTVSLEEVSILDHFDNRGDV